ncbi:MAG TPA: hypothetical protein PKK26_07745 [Candidatus Wallbacteria bacterium]|nr:hypothetical protein [Candidatus Wallbacteria bacterium]
MIKKVQLLITVSLACIFIAAAAASGQTPENITLINCFRFDLDGAAVYGDSLKTDGVFIDFFLTRANFGKNFKVKIQADSGRIENFDPVEEIKLLPPASSEEIYLKYGDLENIQGKPFAFDGPAIASVKLELGAKSFYAAIARDQALYIFPAPVKSVKTQPAFKAYLPDAPRRIYVSKDRIFVLTEKHLSGFQIRRGTPKTPESLAMTSETAYTPAQALKKNIKLFEETNNYSFDTKYLSSDFFRFHKVVPLQNGSSANSTLAYFTGSYGQGNRHIYSLGSDFEIRRVSNFSGVITDFELIDPKKPSFTIKHKKFENSGENPAIKWIYTPPADLAAPKETPSEKADMKSGAGLIAVSKKIPGEERIGVFVAGSIGNEIFKLKKITDGSDTLEEISSFRLPTAAKDLKSPDFIAAISHNVKSPVFAYYAPRSSRVWLIDAIGGHIIDGIYFNQKYGLVTSMKFLGDGNILAIKTDLFEGNDFTRVGSSSLFLYRFEHKTLTEICRHKIISDYDYVRYNNGNHVIMVFGKERTETDSLGIINIR